MLFLKIKQLIFISSLIFSLLALGSLELSAQSSCGSTACNACQLSKGKPCSAQLCQSCKQKTATTKNFQENIERLEAQATLAMYALYHKHILEQNDYDIQNDILNITKLKSILDDNTLSGGMDFDVSSLGEFLINLTAFKSDFENYLEHITATYLEEKDKIKLNELKEKAKTLYDSSFKLGIFNNEQVDYYEEIQSKLTEIFKSEAYKEQCTVDKPADNCEKPPFDKCDDGSCEDIDGLLTAEKFKATSLGKFILAFKSAQATNVTCATLPQTENSSDSPMLRYARVKCKKLAFGKHLINEPSTATCDECKKQQQRKARFVRIAKATYGKGRQSCDVTSYIKETCEQLYGEVTYCLYKNAVGFRKVIFATLATCVDTHPIHGTLISSPVRPELFELKDESRLEVCKISFNSREACHDRKPEQDLTVKFLCPTKDELHSPLKPEETNSKTIKKKTDVPFSVVIRDTRLGYLDCTDKQSTRAKK